MSDVQFPEGIFYNEPHANAPEFIVGSISIQKEKLMNWLLTQEVDGKGYLKIDIKRSKKGLIYLALNTWKAGDKQTQNKTASIPAVNYKSEIKPEDLPF